MSDKNESDERANERKHDGKKGRNKLKSEKPHVEKNLNEHQEKFDINQGLDEKQNKITTWNDSEGSSNKHPKLSKDLKELFDNFGQGNSNPKINNPKSYSSEAPEVIKQCSESYSQQSVENIPFTDDLLRTNNDSVDDTTLNGKFIEIKDDSHSCRCHADKCVCDQTDQNFTDIDDFQACFDAKETKLPNGFDPHHIFVVNPNECSKNCEDPKLNRSNRYNFNHVHIRQNQKEILPQFEPFFPGREKKIKHHVSKDDSGETIPQLYKANVKHLQNCGMVPERFTFKAVTGHSPGKLEYCAPMTSYTYDNYTGTNRKSCRKGRREKNTIFKTFMKNRKYKHPDKNRSDFFKYHGFQTHGINKNEYGICNNKFEPYDKGCKEFDGEEYVSTKQLPDRIDIYCFDHLNTSYFRTCDQPPPLITDIAMEKTEEIATRFWAEIFGFVHVVIAFFIAFILQLYKFILYSIVRPLMVGLVQLTSDYFFKPLLTITYNGFTQPLMVFLFNVAASFRDLCSPIAKCLGYFISEIASLLRAIRLIDCSKQTAPSRLVKDSYC